MAEENKQPDYKAPTVVYDVTDLEIGGVVVYPDRAEVKRLIRVELKKGDNDVIVNQLSAVVDSKSLRVEGKGKAVITDVVYQSKTDYQEKTTGDKSAYDKLQDDIKALTEKETVLSYKLEVIEKQRALLNKFADHICKFSADKETETDVTEMLKKGSVDGVMEFFAAYQTKLSRFDDNQQQLKAEKASLTEQIKVLKENAKDHNPSTVKDAKVNRCVCISLEASADGEAELALSYVVSSASWSPQYDLRVFSKDKTMKVLYYALIKQSTGEDWLSAKLSLSTANPSIGGSVPELTTRELRFKKPFFASKSKSAHGAFGGVSSMAMDFGMSGGQERFRSFSYSPPPPMETVTTEVETSWTSVVFNIPRKATVPSDSTEHKVTVAIIDLSPEFEYVAVPRRSPHTYLQASVKNTSSCAFLSGPASVFLDNNFIAKSSLKDVSPSEQFHCSLGVDPSVRLTTHPVSMLRGQTGMISKNVIINYRHKFEVKNTKQEPVKMTFTEQLPLSTDEKIRVHLTEPDVRKVNIAVQLSFGTATLNSSNNLEWLLNIPPETSQPVNLTYSVDYPPGVVVEGLPKN